jgi:hypothetical protein
MKDQSNPGEKIQDKSNALGKEDEIKVLTEENKIMQLGINSSSGLRKRMEHEN